MVGGIWLPMFEEFFEARDGRGSSEGAIVGAS